METPLLDALMAYAGKSPARFHMPGHKGRAPEGLDLFSLDVTELPPTGNLYEGGDVIAQAEGLWGPLFGFPTCQFLTGGSTQGLHTALLLCAKRGREVLADRCSHRAVHNAMAMWDLAPTWLPRPQDKPLAPELLRQGLEAAKAQGKEIKTVCITSPTYYGVLSDVSALAEVTHSYGGLLVVDGAHGCHLPFLGLDPFGGADLVVCSAHKTLPVLGQGALLFAGSGFSAREVRWAASVNGTSSPSYAVMASMDLARARWSTPAGKAALERTAAWAQKLRSELPALDGPDLDPMRLTALVPGGAGFGWKAKLEEQGVYPEMADRDHLVFLLSPENTGGDMERLEGGLKALYQEAAGAMPGASPDWILPPICLTPRQAMLAPSVCRPLSESEGAVCLEQVAPYPPGVPVIAPGEEITKKGLAYLREVGYNVEVDVNILDQTRRKEAGL